MRTTLIVYLMVTVVYIGYFSPTANARAAQKTYRIGPFETLKFTDPSKFNKRSCECFTVNVEGQEICPPCDLSCQCGYIHHGGENLACAACGCQCGSCISTTGNTVCCTDTVCECPCGACGGSGYANSAAPAGAPAHCCSCCFPGSGTVKLRSGKSVKMSELQIGDRVQTVSSTGSVTYTEVRTFMKKQSTVSTAYKSITTSWNNTISLSENHLLYARKYGTDKFQQMSANEVSVRDEVLVQDNDKLTPTKIKSVVSSFTDQGAYVPVTMDGNIIVDGVLASCYAFPDHNVAHIGMTPLRWFPQIMELIFGVEDGILGYVNIMDHLGHLWLTNKLRYGTSSN